MKRNLLIALGFTLLLFTAAKQESYTTHFLGDYSDMQLENDVFKTLTTKDIPSSPTYRTPERLIAEADAKLKLDPKNAEAYIKRARALCAQGNWDEGMIEVEKALKSNPFYSDAHAGRGIILLHQEKLDEAILEFNEAVKLSPTSKEGYAGLIIAYFNNKDYDRTWETVHRAKLAKLNLNPTFLENLRKVSGRKK